MAAGNVLTATLVVGLNKLKHYQRQIHFNILNASQPLTDHKSSSKNPQQYLSPSQGQLFQIPQRLNTSLLELAYWQPKMTKSIFM